MLKDGLCLEIKGECITKWTLGYMRELCVCPSVEDTIISRMTGRENARAER